MVICPNNPAQLGVTLPYDGTHSQFTVVPSQSVTQTSNGRTEDDDAATLRRCCRLYLYMRLTRIHLSDVDSNHTIPDCRNVVAELGRKAEGRKARQLSWQLLAVAHSLTHSLTHSATGSSHIIIHIWHYIVLPPTPLYKTVESLL